MRSGSPLSTVVSDLAESISEDPIVTMRDVDDCCQRSESQSKSDQISEFREVEVLTGQGEIEMTC